MSAQPPGQGQDMAGPPLRPPGGPQQPPRPQPPPGVQVSGPPPRQFVPGGPVAQQPPPRTPLPPRPSGPNSFAPQQPRPPQAAAPLQPGPPQQAPLPQQPPPRRQPPPQQFQQQLQSQTSLEKINFQPRPPAPLLSPASRQSSQANLNILRPQMEPEGTPPAVAKNRSYSIAGPPVAPNAHMAEEERRRSLSGIGGRTEEPISRGPGLGLIKENVQSYDTTESPLNVGLTRHSKEDIMRGSRESVRSDTSEGKIERPESRLSGSRMTESIMGSLDGDERKNGSPKIRARNIDDDDDVVIQNNRQSSLNQNGSPSPNKSPSMENGYKVSASPVPPPLDRSPSLTKSDSSPEQRQNLVMGKVDSPNRPASVLSNASKTPEPMVKPPTPTAVRPPSAQSNRSEHRMSTPDPKNEESRNRTPDSAVGRPQSRAGAKPTNFETPIKTPEDRKPPMGRKVVSAPRTRREGDNDSGVDESTQGNDHVNGSPGSPGKKSPTKIPGFKAQSAVSAGGKHAVARSPSKSAVPHTPNTPDSTTSNTSIEKKKVPMNKVQVGSAPSPNIKAVKSKIGSLENTTHKPGGGKIKIENRKLDFQKVTPRIAAKNDAYTPGGGDKKITQKKLQWTAKSKIGSLDNTNHKPGGGDKKIETVKLDFKDKAKPKVASTVNMNHKPGGGDIKFVKWPLRRWRASYKHVPIRPLWKIENQKLDIKAQSKVGSLDNVKHKPGGGDVKIFDDKDYLKQIAAIDHVASPPSEDDEEEQYQETVKRRQSVMMSARNGSARLSQRQQRPRTARESSAHRQRYASPRKCQTPRIENDKPPFRTY